MKAVLIVVIVVIVLALIVVGILFATRGCGTLTADLSASKDTVQHLYGDTSNTETVPSGGHAKLREGDGVSVNASGYARIDMGGCVLAIYRDSGLQVEGLPTESAPVCIVGFENGSILNQVDKKTIVNTDWAVITTLSTNFFVHLDQARGIAWVIVKNGSVSVEAGGGRVVVGPGQQTWVWRGQQPEPVRPAARAQVGRLFPTLDALTNGELHDDDLLTPAPPDSPPQVQIQVNPPEPLPGQRVSIAAYAKDDRSIQSIELSVSGKTVARCAESPCTYVTEFGQARQYPVSAVAVDTAGQTASAEAVINVAVPPVGFTVTLAGGPLEDTRVRDAVLQSVTWKDLSARVFDGNGAPIPVEDSQGERLYADAREIPYDRAVALKLLAEAGYPNGFVLVLLYLDGDDQLAESAKWVAEEVQASGIQVTSAPATPEQVKAFLSQPSVTTLDRPVTPTVMWLHR